MISPYQHEQIRCAEKANKAQMRLEVLRLSS
jgi:hypothetical protein